MKLHRKTIPMVDKQLKRKGIYLERHAVNGMKSQPIGQLGM
jgi:hypothetical protein